MTQLASVLSYLDALLESNRFTDSGLNGLQVESGRGDVRRVAVAVDAGLSVIERAVAAQADLLIVHHGVFWGEVHPITGAFARKVELLLRNHCSLYASHLPLDAHREVGNNFELARFYGLERLEPWYEHRGQVIGVRGVAGGRSLETFVTRSGELIGGRPPLVLPFGRAQIHQVGIISGGGSFALAAAARERFDLFISGEPKQAAYHEAHELGINALFAGHYATETFGVRALAARLQRDFEVETLFIDEPTGI